MGWHASERTGEQWSKVEPLIPRRKPSKKGDHIRGANRRGFQSILWALRSGARCNDLPPQCHSPVTSWRRLQEWEDAGSGLAYSRSSLANSMNRASCRGTRRSAAVLSRPHKQGAEIGNTNRGKGAKLIMVAEDQGELWHFAFTQCSHRKSGSSSRRVGK